MTVDLTGSGVTPPEIDLNTDMLSVSLLQGSYDSQTITIYNNGGSDLHWELDIIIHLKIYPPQQ